MQLSEIRTDDEFIVSAVPSGTIKAQTIRLGIFEGAVLKCVYKFKNGPIILEKNSQEIALGHSIAEKIKVNLIRDVQGLERN